MLQPKDIKQACDHKTRVYKKKVLPSIKNDWRKQINEEKILAEHQKMWAFATTYN